MIVPIQNIKGLVYNESIYLDNALKILKYWDDIISKLPDGRERIRPTDFIKKICKNTHPSIMFIFTVKELGKYGTTIRSICIASKSTP